MTTDEKTNCPTLWAFIGVDEGDGIVSEIIPGMGMVPLVTADKNHLENMSIFAKAIAEATGKAIELREYPAYKVLNVFKPITH